jgi:hypothetical protein
VGPHRFAVRQLRRSQCSGPDAERVNAPAAARQQVHFGTGGPPDPEHLYTEALLAEAFADLDIEVLHSYDAVIAEGSGHAGRSAVIDLIARKRSTPPSAATSVVGSQ